MIIVTTAFGLTAFGLSLIAWKSLHLEPATAIFVALIATGLLALLIAGIISMGALI